MIRAYAQRLRNSDVTHKNNDKKRKKVHIYYSVCRYSYYWIYTFKDSKVKRHNMNYVTHNSITKYLWHTLLLKLNPVTNSFYALLRSKDCGGVKCMYKINNMKCVCCSEGVPRGQCAMVWRHEPGARGHGWRLGGRLHLQWWIRTWRRPRWTAQSQAITGYLGTR